MYIVCLFFWNRHDSAKWSQLDSTLGKSDTESNFLNSGPKSQLTQRPAQGFNTLEVMRVYCIRPIL